MAFRRRRPRLEDRVQELEGQIALLKAIAGITLDEVLSAKWSTVIDTVNGEIGVDATGTEITWTEDVKARIQAQIQEGMQKLSELS